MKVSFVKNCSLSLAVAIVLCLAQARISFAQGYVMAKVYSVPTQNTHIIPQDTNIEVSYPLGASPTAKIDKKAVTLLVAFTITPPEGNYFYGVKETVGLPTQLSLTAATAGAKAQKLPVFVRLPASIVKKESDFASTQLVGVDDSDTLIFAGSATFVARITVPEQGALLTGSASGLFCTAAHCMPFTEPFELSLSSNVSALPSATNASWWKEYAQGALIPLNTNADADAFFVATSKGGTVFAAKEGAAPATVFGSGGGLGLTLQNSNATTVQKDEAYIANLALDPQYFNPDLEVGSVWKALWLGLAAGLILNLMPCVLPVVSLKFSALLAVTAMTNKKEQAKAFRNHCLIFAAGVLTWFLFLALMLGLAGWAWGELFQNPVALATLGMILFLLSLSLFGVFSLPIFDLKVATQSNPHWQAFASGLLATLLATPCSGPLLGGVIGWAIRQPLPLLITSIMCIGVGMTLPYCVLAVNPRFINLLPRPGAWTIRLEQLLGFFLLGSVVYLSLLLPADWYAGYLTVLLAVAFAAWLWGQIGHLNASTLRRVIAKTCAVLVVLSAVGWARLTVHRDFDWQEFSPVIFEQVMGNEPLLLEFTADWCPNCKILEQTTLSSERMAVLRDKYKLKTLRVDLTKFDKIGFELLSALGSKTMPLIAIFPVGVGKNKPVVLRDIVTPSQLEDALESVYAP